MTSTRYWDAHVFFPWRHEAYWMKSNEKSKLRLMIESLCEGMEEFWRRDEDTGERVVNIYQLHQSLVRWAKAQDRKAPSQSTLARNYSGETDHFSPDTAQALSDFFRVPKAVVTGDLRISSEAWGVDITTSEIRWIMLLRELNPDQRNVIYSTIKALLPPDIPSPPVPPGVSPLVKPPRH
jgi:hypothetical protein